MPKKNSNKNYLELMLFSLLILDAYLYSKTNGDDKYNDPYNYPHKTLYNWAPTALVSLLLTSTFLTSLILMLNPQEERKASKTSNPAIDNILLYAPATMALAQKVESILTTSFLGERASVINSLVDSGVEKTEIATHIVISQREIHDDLIRRSVKVSGTQEYQIRLVEMIGHWVVTTYVSSIEAIASYFIASGLVTRYFPPAKSDSESTEIAKFLSAVSIANLVGKTLIDDHFLALKIMIDKPTISTILKLLHLAGRGAITFKNTDFLDKVAQVGEQFATELAEAFKHFEENSVAFLLKEKAKLKTIIIEFTTKISELGETIEADAKKYALEIEQKTREFAATIKEKAAMIETMLSQITSLNNLLEEANRIKEALGNELHVAKQKLQEFEASIEEQAALIETKLLEITRLNSLLEEANRIKETLEHQLHAANQRLQEFEAKIGKEAEHIGEEIVEAAKYTKEQIDKATILQAHFRGILTRKHLKAEAENNSKDDRDSHIQKVEMGESKIDAVIDVSSATVVHHDEASQPKTKAKDEEATSKKDDSSAIIQPTVTNHDEKPQEKHHHHGVFGTIEDGLHNIGTSISGAFHSHGSSSGSSAEKEKKADTKQDSSTAADKKGSSAGADKAANDDFNVFDHIYIKLDNSTQTPVITIDFSRINQETQKYPKPTNKERDEYEAARTAAENKNGTSVKYNYDGVILERPEIYSAPKKYGIGEEISNNLDNPELMGNNLLYAM